MTPDGSVQIFADALRITALDPNGFPAVGNAVYVTNAMVHATFTPEVETGDDIVTKTASGDIGARYKHGDMAKYYGVSLELTQPDEMIEQLLCGGVIYTDSSAALVAPAGTPTGVASSGGSFPAGSLFYKITALSPYGETLPSTETAAIPVTLGQKVTVSWAASAGAVGYRIYRTSGATNTEQYIATVGAVTSYIDLGTITPNGVMPTANTTAGPGVNTGLQAPALGIVGNPYGASLELWGKAILNGQHRDPLGYRRWVWPLCTNFRPDARAFDNVQLANVYLGQAFENANWGTGPFGDWPFDSTKVWQRARATRLLLPASYLGSVPATV